MINQNKKAPLQDLINTTGHQNQNNNNATACEKQVANDNKLHDFKEYYNHEEKNNVQRFIKNFSTFFEECKITRNDKVDTDLKGVDYLCDIHGFKFTLDQKNRRIGTYKNWKNPNSPELTIEWRNIYHYKNGDKKNPGWTFDSNKINDLIPFTFEDIPGFIFLVARIPFFLTLYKTKTYLDRNVYKIHKTYSQDKATGIKWETHNIFENIPRYLVNELKCRFIPNIPPYILRELILMLLAEYKKITGHDLFFELKRGA